MITIPLHTSPAGEIKNPPSQQPVPGAWPAGVALPAGSNGMPKKIDSHLPVKLAARDILKIRHDAGARSVHQRIRSTMHLTEFRKRRGHIARLRQVNANRGKSNAQFSGHLIEAVRTDIKSEHWHGRILQPTAQTALPSRSCSKKGDILRTVQRLTYHRQKASKFPRAINAHAVCVFYRYSSSSNCDSNSVLTRTPSASDLARCFNRPSPGIRAAPLPSISAHTR